MRPRNSEAASGTSAERLPEPLGEPSLAGLWMSGPHSWDGHTSAVLSCLVWGESVTSHRKHSHRTADGVTVRAVRKPRDSQGGFS